jgi:hypothetical protein
MENFAMNMPLILAASKIEKSPKSLKPMLIVGAGPSIRAKEQIKILKEWWQEGSHAGMLDIVATDRMFIPLLENDITPDYVITVDGNREKIIKWYDSPLVNGGSVSQAVVLSNTTAPNVAKLLVEKGVRIAWFIAMLDSFQLPTNVTRLMYYMTGGATPINCGGNAGTGGWALANYLQASEIALIGLDFGYLEGTPIEQTAYYSQIEPALKSNSAALNGFYFDDFNPDFGVKCYSDIMFKHYKMGFLEMLMLSKIPTFNCTEGGIVYGTGLRGMKFKDYLDRLTKKGENNGHEA